MYDVTEYEDSNTEHTPLFHLVFLDTECLGKASTTEFFDNKMIKCWISSKIKTNVSALVIWLFTRIFFVAIFIAFDMRQTSFEEEAFMKDIKYNYTNASFMSEAFMRNNRLTSCLMRDYNISVFDYICVVYILSSCLFRILVCTYVTTKFLTQWLKHYPMLCYPHRRKNPICKQGLIYMFTALNGSLFAVIFTISKLFRLKFDIEISLNFEDFAHFNVFLCTCVEFLAICQVIPKVGSFPMTINRLFGDLYSFSAILALFMSPFIMTLHHTINRRHKVCTLGFSNYIDSYYSMFLAMINMLDVEKLAKGLEIKESTPTLYFLHFFYVFTVSILLLNFLIALFSHSVAKTMEHENILVPLNNLNIMLYLEKSMNGILGWWFKIMKRKCFTYRDGRLFITSVTIKAPSKRFVLFTGNG